MNSNLTRLKILTEQLAQTHRGARILLVEDDLAVGDVLTQFFTTLAGDVSIVWARTGDEALSYISDTVPFDLVWLDVVLPYSLGDVSVCGVDIAKKLRSISPSIPIVVCSGMYEYEHIHRLLDAVGVLVFLKKPVGLDDVRGVLRLAGVMDRIICPDCPRFTRDPRQHKNDEGCNHA